MRREEARTAGSLGKPNLLAVYGVRAVVIDAQPGIYEYPRAVVAASLDRLKDLGFEFATRAGLTISISDIRTPEAKKASESPSARLVACVGLTSSSACLSGGSRLSR